MENKPTGLDFSEKWTGCRLFFRYKKKSRTSVFRRPAVLLPQVSF
ncbi:hypothetical protein MY9_3067 [Bacillus sp. JS]|nr:hypothetical protein MY9_3067 [Bacillus sp. JS]